MNDINLELEGYVSGNGFAGAIKMSVDAYLLGRAVVCKHVLDRYFKLAHIVLPKSVLVPAAGIKHEALLAYNRHIDRLVPYWIEGFVYRRGGFFCVSKGKHKILDIAVRRFLCSAM